MLIIIIIIRFVKRQNVTTVLGIIAGVEMENGSHDPDHAPFRGGLLPES